MTRHRHALLLALVTSLAGALSMEPLAHAQQPVSAQDLATARNLYHEGKELRAKGDLQGALVKLRAAHAIGKTPITGIELAHTELSLGHLVEAREVCLEIARLPVAPDETERSVAARNEAAQMAEEIKPRVPTLVIRLTGVPAGKVPTVLVDKMEVPAAQVGEPRNIDPGKHEILAHVGRGADVSALVDIAEKESREVVLPVPPEPEGPVTPPPPSGGRGEKPVATERHPHTAIAALGFGVAAVGAIVGISTGAVALSKESDLESKCPNKGCTPAYQSELDQARTVGTVSTVAFVVAGVGLGVGIWGLLSTSETPVKATRAHVEPWLSPTGAGVRGAF